MKTLIITLSLLCSACAVPSFEQRMAFAQAMMGFSQSAAFNRQPFVGTTNQPVQVQIVQPRTGLTCATINCN